MFEDLRKTWQSLLKFTLKQLSMMFLYATNSGKGTLKEKKGHVSVIHTINDFSSRSSQRTISSPHRIFSHGEFKRVVFILIQAFFGGGDTSKIMQFF